MTETEIEAALVELDLLLNDLDTRMDPDRVWALLAQVSPCLRDTDPSILGLTMMGHGTGGGSASAVPASR